MREALDRGYDLLRDDRRGFFSKVFQPLPIRLKSGLVSSLYSLRVGRDIRLVMAVDDDPAFGQTLVTLFRVVGSDGLERAYRSTAKLLYDGQVARRNTHRHGRFTASPGRRGRCARFQSPRP